MLQNYLKLNDDKTEVLVVTQPTIQKKLSLPPLHIGDSTIIPSKHVCDLGFIFDSTMKLEVHIKQVCRIAYFNLHNIFRLRRYLDADTLKTLVNWSVTSRLDYGNGLLHGVSDKLLQQLQVVQNTAARLITKAPEICPCHPVSRTAPLAASEISCQIQDLAYNLQVPTWSGSRVFEIIAPLPHS